jgi:hypothetical protein
MYLRFSPPEMKFTRSCIVALLAVLFVGAMVEPNRTIISLARGEAFYRMRPTSYWQSVIAVDGKSGFVRQSTLDVFDFDPRAVPVLRQCLAHPNAQVRRRSVLLMQRSGSHRDQSQLFIVRTFFFIRGAVVLCVHRPNRAESNLFPLMT